MKKIELNSFKTRFVNTSCGRFALAARNTLELVRTGSRRPEILGALANDLLATRLVTTLCLPKKGFIDVGAHIGSILSAVIHRDPSIKLYAIEPVPAKLRHLRRRFPTVELHECALGEADGESSFFVNTKQSAYSSLLKPRHNEGVEIISVAVKRLDGLISANDIDLIKIDVEGAELGVLRGGDMLINKNRPTIMFESGPEADDGPKVSLWRWLEERDFDVVVPNRVAHDGRGLSSDSFLEAHLYPVRTINYFAIPRERRIEIRDRARSVLSMTT